MTDACHSASRNYGVLGSYVFIFLGRYTPQLSLFFFTDAAPYECDPTPADATTATTSATTTQTNPAPSSSTSDQTAGALGCFSWLL